MSERGSTAGFALGALLLFFVLMFGGRSSGPGIDEPARPTSIESAANGLGLARQWLEGQGVRVESLRDGFDGLAQRAPRTADGAGASLLVLTLPGAAPIQTHELAPLDRWLRDGNTLLVLAALSDAPDWSVASAGAPVYDLRAVTGLEFETVAQRRARLAATRGGTPAAAADDADAAAAQADDATAGGADDALRGRMREPRLLARAERLTALPLGREPLLAGVAAWVAESDYRRTSWSVRLPYDGVVLELARERDGGEGVLWRRAHGRGEIVVSAWATPFSNRALGLADNGRLLANLVARAVGPRGAVLFDDGHQGLAPRYDPVQLFGDRRLHVTVGLLLGLWLLWVLGATRLRTPGGATPAPRPAELLRAAGGFYARVLAPAPAARRLCEHFFARLPARGGAAGRGSTVGHAPPPWDWLEQHPRLAPPDVRQLRAWYGDALAGRRVSLANLHNLLLRLERQLA